jgi:hypothetical protein
MLTNGNEVKRIATFLHDAYHAFDDNCSRYKICSLARELRKQNLHLEVKMPLRQIIGTFVNENIARVWMWKEFQRPNNDEICNEEICNLCEILGNYLDLSV